jgi:hypothetical protein
MTKEQIIAAIAEATGYTPTRIDDAFISKIKEQNKGDTVTIWRGTTAEYNEIEERERDPYCIYIKTDDTTIADFEKRVSTVEEETEAKLTAFGNEIGKMQPYGLLDSFTAAGMPLYGYITTNGSVITFLLPLSKPISDTINDFAVKTLELYVAGVNGLVGGGKIDARGIDYFMEITKYENGLKFSVQNLNGAFSGAVNATPIVINANIDIVFTTKE